MIKLFKNYISKVLIFHISLLTVGCQQSIDFIQNEQYIQEVKSITYFRGEVFNGVFYNKHTNGNKSEEVFFDNGKKYLWKWYNKNGELENEGLRIDLFLFDDLNDNEDIEISKDSLNREILTMNGEPFNGRIFRYYETKSDVKMENLYKVVPIFNGMSNGKIVYYHESGSPKIEIDVVNGLYNGESKVYSEDGKLISIENYLQGELLKTNSFFPNGVLEEEGVYLENNQQWEVITYFSDGSKKSEGKWNRDRTKIGEWKYFNNNGNINTKEIYLNDGSLSERINLFKDGTIQQREYFKQRKDRVKIEKYNNNGNIIERIFL